jgi:hypothetical protein
MGKRYIHFRDNILTYFLLLLIIVVGAISYYRFIMVGDYMVGYEGKCDPTTGKCFMSCEDDACTKINYYSEMQKYEPDLYGECGEDITDCEAANVCLPSDRKCSITYCDKNANNNDSVCQTPTETQLDVQNND